MTIAILAALALVAAIASGGDHGYSNDGGELSRVVVSVRTVSAHREGPHPGSGRVEGRGQAQPHVLRIHNLAADGIATLEPVATATAEPTIRIPRTVEPTRDAPVFGYGIEQWRSLVASIFPAWAVDEALYVISRESEGVADIWNRQGSGACGLFQLLPCTAIDPEGNVRGAYAKWIDGGQSFHKHWYRWW